MFRLKINVNFEIGGKGWGSSGCQTSWNVDVSPWCLSSFLLV